MCESTSLDADGFQTWKSWGGWSLRFTEDSAGLLFAERDYWIELSRVHEEDWEEHMLHKDWCKAERVTFPCRREHEPLRSAWGHVPLGMDFAEFCENVARGCARDYEFDSDAVEYPHLYRASMSMREAAENLCRSIDRNSTRHLPIVGNENHNDLVRALGFCRLLVLRRRSAQAGAEVFV
jgi:hypothetical protein